LSLTKQEALDMLESDDLLGIGMAAHQMRLKKTDPRVATYQIDRNINYTNFCTEYCSFCAFYRPLGAKDGYLLSFESIYEKIDEMLELGGTGVLLQFAAFFETALSPSASALLFCAGNSLHCGSQRA
jgi:cyclic dehypoxanthinyl futalosine synthase